MKFSVTLLSPGKCFLVELMLDKQIYFSRLVAYCLYVSLFSFDTHFYAVRGLCLKKNRISYKNKKLSSIWKFNNELRIFKHIFFEICYDMLSPLCISNK